ncbi:hypothetical protein [Helicobacter cappadocius]|uniref:Uncharacterized protein n=1 Tax=Helicobacter cappadocius TaxID=3063998 RepID=A0AA90PJ77_9HELI|nr:MULTISPECIES: hypothetical protein [unclassified Helicobacter]MDO7253058.1 hypothetical protein [Helicobacter sp. faydin-H75]MDP2538816.1 hypothetical protein [Helicobacter sp. faydin-H76]
MQNKSRKNKNTIYGKTRTKSKKSQIIFDDLKKRLRLLNSNISSFSRYSGISTPTIYGWQKNGIPMYVQRIIELLEAKKITKDRLKELSEINTI